MKHNMHTANGREQQADDVRMELLRHAYIFTHRPHSMPTHSWRRDCAINSMRFFCARVLVVQTRKPCERTMKKEKNNIDNCNMFFSTNILMRHVLGIYESVYTKIATDDMQEEWCEFRRMPKGLFLPSLNLRNFGVLLFYLFIVHSTSFFMQRACEHSTKRNTKNRFRWDLSLNIFQRVEHKPINVLFSMYSTHSSTDFARWERERQQRKKTQREAAAARKNRIKCFLAMKIYSKSLCGSLSVAKISARHFYQHVSIASLWIYQPPHICHEDIFNLHIE